MSISVQVENAYHTLAAVMATMTVLMKVMRNTAVSH